MKLRINGAEEIFEGVKNLSELIERLELAERTFALALNFTVVPRKAFAMTELKDDDEIEILVPMQGG